jgi:hypothetical protein
MVRRRSTVRFRNGAPSSEKQFERFEQVLGGRSGGQVSYEACTRRPRLRSVELCGGSDGSVMDLLDCFEDHRRGALD